jgi:hypothetical protein
MPYSDMREAKWLPSRCSFAFFRLIGLLVLASRTPTPARQGDRATMYVTGDRHQSSLENYSLSVLFLAFATSFLWILASAWGPVRPTYAIALIPASFALAPIAMQAVCYATGGVLAIARALGLRKSGVNNTAQSRAFIAAFTCAAAAALLREGLPRAVGIAWMIVLAINLASAVLLYPLRHRLSAAETRLGGSVSGA